MDKLPFGADSEDPEKQIPEHRIKGFGIPVEIGVLCLSVGLGLIAFLFVLMYDIAILQVRGKITQATLQGRTFQKYYLQMDECAGIYPKWFPPFLAGTKTNWKLFYNDAFGAAHHAVVSIPMEDGCKKLAPRNQIYIQYDKQAPERVAYLGIDSPRKNLSSPSFYWSFAWMIAAVFLSIFGYAVCFKNPYG